MLTKYQEHLYKLYKEIDDICTRFDIEYCAAGGTMIGAIRHRGFIPWDDDMDIYMTLKNWRKFMDACSQDGVLLPNRALACQEFDRSYHNVIGRYTDLSMTTIHKNQVLHDDQAGFVIDILTLDPIPDDKESAHQYNKDVLLFSDLINGSMAYSYRFRANKFRFLYYRLKMRIFGKEKVLQQVQDMVTQYDEDKCDFYAMRWGGVPLIFPKDMIGDCSLRFRYEDMETRCPNKPFDYLVYHYGDEWMYVPPKSEQVRHNSVAVFNTDVEYPNMKSEIYEILDVKKTRKKLRTRQKIALLHENSWNDLKDENLEIYKAAFELYFHRFFSNREEEIDELVKAKDYVSLSGVFSEYIDFQNNRRTIGRFDPTGAYRYYAPILIEVEQKWFELILLTLFHTGRIAVAKRFIDVYLHNKGTLSPKCEEINNDILKFRSAVAHFAQGEYRQTGPLIDELIEKYPRSQGVLLLQISRYTRIDGIAKTRDKVRELAERGLEIFPKNKDFIKCLLDTEYDEDKENVLLKYVYLYRRLLNGFFRLDIHDIVEENIGFFFNFCDNHILETFEESPLAVYFKDDLSEDSEDSEGEDEEEDGDEEELLDDTVNAQKEKEERRKFKSISVINKIIGILPDDARAFEKKFEILKKFADAETDEILKALAQHRLIKYIRKVTRKYSSKFEDGQYPEIQAVVEKWFRDCYFEFTRSSYITKMTEIFYQKKEFEERKALLDQVLEDMQKMKKYSSEYLYALELVSRIYGKLGMSSQSGRCLLECIEHSDIPYLNRKMRKKFKNEIVTIYKKLYSSYNKFFIHRGIEIKGLTKEEAYSKERKNKQRLIKFYKNQIDEVFPSVMQVLRYLIKLYFIDETEAHEIIKKCKLNENSKFTLRNVTEICRHFESMNFAFFDEDSMEEIDDVLVDNATEEI